MTEHVFGGSWTEAKLGRLKAYLEAYRNIFTTNLRATYFTTWYVDAFAGTGMRSTGSLGPGLLDLEDGGLDRDVAKYLAGSAKIALGLRKPFDRYLFIEKSKARAEALIKMIATDHPELLARCEVRVDDANLAIAAWSRERNWRKDRAVVFLDPYGMQVEWETVELLGKTLGVDLWYLFPLGGVLRMLSKKGVTEEGWRERLDSVFGTSDWSSYFYKTRTEPGLFEEREIVQRDATVTNIKEYIQHRLQSCFEAVAPSLVLRNAQSFPQFALCFAAANKQGSKAALSIATHLLKDD